ncbi:tryptophan--tRNA ligase [Candidatus Azambacteria bacterium]|nr:tryptophan--tRNA ligase [Candidatus Azambacteria bacterium]
MMTKKRILTGDRPTGSLHLGHYVGSIQNRVKLQNEGNEVFTIISDFQYLTDRLETKDVERNTLELLLDYLACGINPDTSPIFIQSKVPALAELFVYLSMLVPVSRAQQNPTVKEEVRATAKGKMSLGMLSFPVSQAADILAFDTDLVPVGEDQLPHIEQTREVARAFNRVYGETFKEPEALLSKVPRLMGLDANQKMSKSRGNAVFLSDSKDTVVKKIKTAVTDSGKEIMYDKENKPALANLLMMYHLFSGKEIKAVETMYEGKGYAEFKADLAEVVNAFLEPIRRAREEFAKDEAYLSLVLKQGTARASEESEKTMKRVRKAMRYDYPHIFH